MGNATRNISSIKSKSIAQLAGVLQDKDLEVSHEARLQFMSKAIDTFSSRIQDLELAKTINESVVPEDKVVLPKTQAKPQVKPQSKKKKVVPQKKDKDESVYSEDKD